MNKTFLSIFLLLAGALFGAVSHNKTIILLNLDHYWDNLLAQFKIMVEKNALK